MVGYCAMFGCLSSSRNDKDRSFFRFPKDERRCKQWVQAAGRPELRDKTADALNKGYYICDLHFEATDRLSKKLKTFAIPSLNLPNQENVNPTKSTQTVDVISEEPITNDGATQTWTLIDISDATTQTTQLQTYPTENLSANIERKRKLLKELRTKCKERKILEKQQAAASALRKKKCNMSPQLQKLIDWQIKLKHNSPGNRYDKDLKLFALNVYLASPLAYRVLAKTLSLPSERTLRRININIGTKLSPDVLKCLQNKVRKLKELEKYCIICAGEISLKRYLHYQINEDRIIGFHEIDETQTAEPATQAFVIMARGIFSNWKQPLAYCFLAQSKNYRELSTWLDYVISQILSIGFLVVALVSDQGSNFLNMANDRNVTVDKPYFFIEGKKIYYIFDVPHLMKSVRNNLMKYDFEFSDTDETKVTAKWEDVKKFYKQDCDRAYRLAPKLTESHINPSNFEKMKVKYATQVFSSTVAAAMNCSIECGRLEKTASGTVKLIELMDKTFDVLNSSVVDNSNKYKIAFASKPHQTEVLDQFDFFLSNVRVLNSDKKNVTNAIQCLQGLKITLNSIQSLSQDLQPAGFRFLFTRRLNQDPLVTFFDSVRQQGGNCREPTPLQFSKAFRNFFMVNIVKHSENANCTDDLYQLLMNTDDKKDGDNILSSDWPVDENSHEETSIDSLTVGVNTVDYRFDLPKKNAFVYVCGYLLKKCFDIHKCEGINQYVKTNSQTQEDNVIIQLKSFNQNTLLIINPPISFVTCIKAMDDQFKKSFQNKILGPVGKEILKKIKDICVTDCCSCFPNLYLQKLFIRFRIFNTMQFNNHSFRDKSLKRTHFSVSNIL